MVTQVRHGAPFSRLDPAAARPRIPFDAALVTEPQFHLGIRGQHAQFIQKLLSLLFILPFGPGLGHAQVKVQFMQPAHRGAVAQLDLELFLEIPVELDAGPMDLAGPRGIVQHRHQQIAHALQFDFAAAAGPGLGDQRVDAAAIEQFNPQAHHAVGPTKLLAQCGARQTQEERANGIEPDVGALVGRGLHRHTQLIE
jgi:hypothetical protein